ncbi:MAG: hypothetical protein IIT46_17730 [Lachnospiraceae bacterium]|nr:hypothetical protein [Lachnospiraceae bacterium]
MEIDLKCLFECSNECEECAEVLPDILYRLENVRNQLPNIVLTDENKYICNEMDEVIRRIELERIFLLKMSEVIKNVVYIYERCENDINERIGVESEPGIFEVNYHSVGNTKNVLKEIFS